MPESTSSTALPRTTVATTAPSAIPISTSLPPQTVPAPELTSVGEITIAEIDYRFTFECYAAGAGDVLALGVGVDPVTTEATEAIVQAFFGQPYVAVVVEDGAVFELAVDRQAELFVQDGSIHGSALRFVASTGAQSSGIGTELGLGSVTVDCDGFALGLPDGYVLTTSTTELG